MLLKCKSCGEEKVLELFTKEKRNKNGYCQPCKVCKNKDFNRNLLARSPDKNKDYYRNYSKNYYHKITKNNLPRSAIASRLKIKKLELTEEMYEAEKNRIIEHRKRKEAKKATAKCNSLQWRGK